ncbi:hypothetical protein ACJJTC_014697 [Scirpophaga incertulas]
MEITTTASSAFDKVYLDLVGPLDNDLDDNRYILTIQCELSKYVQAFPLKNKDTNTVADAFARHFILRFGVPRAIATDRGTEFMSTTMEQIDVNINCRRLFYKYGMNWCGRGQEHRADTAQLLLRHGAQPALASRAGDDALRTAALRGNEPALRVLAARRPPPAPAALADAYELLGATHLDELADWDAALVAWRAATALRRLLEKLPMGRSECSAPKPAMPPPAALAPATEWRSLAELDALSADIDALRTQALLVAVRVLGAHHKDTLLRIMHRGASYADAFRYQKCIDLWVWALELRIQKDTLLYTDTYHTACAITRLMLDALQARLERADGAPRFQDVLRVLALLARQLPECRRLLSRRPVHKKQGEAWDRVLRCLTHLLHLLLQTAATDEELALMHKACAELVAQAPRSLTGDSLLHLSASCLNVVRSAACSRRRRWRGVLLRCGARADATNATRSTPLHVAAAPYNFCNALVAALLPAARTSTPPTASASGPRRCCRGSRPRRCVQALSAAAVPGTCARCSVELHLMTLLSASAAGVRGALRAAAVPGGAARAARAARTRAPGRLRGAAPAAAARPWRTAPLVRGRHQRRRFSRLTG